MKTYQGIFVALLCMNYTHLYAGTTLKDISIDGLMTSAITQSDNDTDTAYNNGSATEKLDFSGQNNVLGLQIKADIGDSLKVASQLIARGGSSNYDLEVDWAYLDFHTSTNSNLHVGKFKIPLFIASDYIDVGFAYPWVRPPQEVYSVNPLIALSGLDWFYNIPLKGHNILIQTYYGNGSHQVYVPARSIDMTPIPIPKDRTVPVSTRDTGGINVTLQSDIFSFRLGYFQAKVDANALLIDGAKGSFTGIGFTLDTENVVLYSEYVSRDIETDTPRAFPDQKAWYITLGYKFQSLLPYITYASIGQGEDETPLSVEQKSAALGVRYDFNKSSAFKFEALQATPEEGNHGLFHEPVEKGMIYTGSVDVIF